jgi:hypothetical protein
VHYSEELLNIFSPLPLLKGPVFNRAGVPYIYIRCPREGMNIIEQLSQP